MVWYVGECIVSVININNGIKEPTRGYKNYETNHILIFGGHVEVSEFLHTQVINWVNAILAFHIDTRTILPRYEGFCMVYRLEWYQKTTLSLDSR